MEGSSLERRLVQLVDISLLVDLGPLERTLRKLDYRAIQRSRKWLKIAATNWATGELRVFWNHDMTDGFGPVVLRASAAVPGIFPPAEVGAQPFVDGSVLMNTPLSLAIHAGADVLHVIYLDPDVSSIPLPRIPQSFSTMQRMLQIGWAAAYNADIAAASRINRTLQAVDEIRPRLPVGDRAAELLQGLVETRTPTGRKPFRRLTIHRYHPHEELSSGALGMLNLDRDHLEDLIDKGYTDATLHDCDQEGCVLPEETHAPIAMIPAAGA